MANPTITLTRGESFAATFYPVPLPEGDWSATSQLRAPTGGLVADLAVTVAAPTEDAPDGFTVLVEAAGTAAWPVAILVADIRFQDGAAVLFSEPFNVAVLGEVTHAPQ